MKHFYISHEFTFPSGFGMCSKLLSLILSMSLSLSLCFTRFHSVFCFKYVKCENANSATSYPFRRSTQHFIWIWSHTRFFSALSSPIYWNFCADYQTHISSNEWMLSCMERYQSMWCYVSVCVCLCQTSAYHFWACQLTAPSTFIQNISSIRFSRWKEKQW